jgi:serine/threonine-protein kinase
MIGAQVRGQIDPQLVRYSMVNRTPTPLGLSGISPTVVDGGYLLYTDLTGTLFAVRIDPKRGTLLGKPATITTGVRVVQLRAMYAASRNGTIVYARSGATPNSQMVIVDRAGKGVALPVAGKPYRTPRFSPDGRRLAMTIRRGDGTNNGDVWTYDFASEGVNRLTFDGLSISPSWKPDGRTIVFAHRELGKPDEVYSVPADASVTAQHYFTWAKGAYEAAFTRDGKRIIYRVDGGVGGRDVLVAPVDSPTAVHPLLASPFEEYMIALSPDDKWLAYVSDATGRPEVYLRRVDGAGGVTPVSRNGGTDPRWGGNTNELLFRNKDTITSVPLSLGDEARTGQPRALFAANYAMQPWDTDWDVSPDGKRFVFVREPIVSGKQRMVVLTNWVNGVH